MTALAQPLNYVTHFGTLKRSQKHREVQSRWRSPSHHLNPRYHYHALILPLETFWRVHWRTCRTIVSACKRSALCRSRAPSSWLQLRISNYCSCATRGSQIVSVRTADHQFRPCQFIESTSYARWPNTKFAHPWLWNPRNRSRLSGFS